MMKTRVSLLLLTGLMMLSLMSGCSENASQDSANNETESETAKGSDVEQAALPQSVPSQVFIDLERAGSRVVAVGEAGAIRVSDNNGDSWQAVASGVDSTLTAVAFATDQKGWAVGHGGHVLRTEDGGSQWQRGDMDGLIQPGQALIDVTFGGDNRGVIVGSDALVLTTEDGGDTWARASVPSDNYGAKLTGAAVLDSGHLVIVSDSSEILSQAPGATDWQSVRQSSKPLMGVIGLGGSEALAFGTEGAVLHSPDGGASWEEVKSVSSASYFGGRVLDDGSVVLVGSEGILARRSPDDDTFYPVPDIPLGTLTGVVEAEDGRLVLSGIQGVGYQQDGRYWFHGVENGITGRLVARSLLGRVELQPLLRLLGAGTGYSSGRQSDASAEWVEISMAAKAADEDVLTPSVYREMKEFAQTLSSDRQWPFADLRTLWDERGYGFLLLNGPYGQRHHYPVVPREPAYSDAERSYLERRIQKAALTDRVIAGDYRQMTLFSDVPFRVTSNRDGSERQEVRDYLSDLRESAEAEGRAFRIASMETARLEEVKPGENGKDESHTDATADHLYVISRKEGNSYSCDQVESLAMASRLDHHLEASVNLGPVLSVADLAKLNEVSDNGGNWQWYTTPESERYGNPVYPLWKESYCLNPLAVVFGHPGHSEQTGPLRSILEQFSEVEGTADEFELRTYRVKRTEI